LLVCPTCRTSFEGGEQFCPRDGSPLGGSTPSGQGKTNGTDPLIGRVLGGRYRLVERLGQGGMGTVYRALHTLMDKRVAVKILRAELSSDSEAVARFHREARSASRLDHDHCIRVTDFGQSDDGQLFLVMELLDGESLGNVTRKGRVPPSRAAAIGAAIAEALAHAHEQGIIHRDLKPDNVFLARRGRAKGRELVKVLDFGLAKLASDSALGPSITRDGTVFGTPEYMAPEQAEGEKLDGRTDVYALGIILYQLLCGDVPFRASSFVALLTKQVSDKPEPPSLKCPEAGIPHGLEEIVLRCLAKKPKDRYETAQELADALATFAASDASGMMLLPTRNDSSGARPIPSPPPTVVELPPPSGESSIGLPARRRLGRPLLVGAGLMSLAGLGIIWARLHAAPAPSVAIAADRPEPPLDTARRLASTGDLDGADRILAKLRQEADSAPVQEEMSNVAERRGNRLSALAHLHRATRLAPRDPAPRAELAALLLRLGQPLEACRQARAALALPSKESPPKDAEKVIAQARCKETPIR
jgi:eukaryotic-like serine/threonine-protein kinase